jgi:hypothetical protein
MIASREPSARVHAPLAYRPERFERRPDCNDPHLFARLDRRFTAELRALLKERPANG